eukprot:7382114-Prymnesium_polylepis.1
MMLVPLTLVVVVACGVVHMYSAPCAAVVGSSESRVDARSAVVALAAQPAEGAGLGAPKGQPFLISIGARGL